MNEPTNEEQREPQDVRYDLKSAKEAADYLRISESTVWRYVDQNIVPAYRVGQKRVWFKRSDLDRLVKPRRGRAGKMKTERKDLNLTAMESGSQVDWGVMDRIGALRDSIMARRRAVFSDSAEEINTAREARSQDL